MGFVRVFAFVFVLVSMTGVRAGHAEWAAAPIAVPLIGTQGVAAPYPSTIEVVAPGGPSQSGGIGVVLHAVTHPCPEDLAILLVHDDTEKYLLMSNAGGCRPLQGTSLQFSVDGARLPDSDATSTPYGHTLDIDASNYGAVPVFPAPAPPGPYVATGLPGGGRIGGTWQLYVMDTRGEQRGVIGGGWSLLYDSGVIVAAQQTNVTIPFSGPVGSAATYPITFDLNDVPADVTVTSMMARITLAHEHPDDLRIVLESPAGTTVQLLANAGGSGMFTSGTMLTFVDTAAPMADGTVSSTTIRPSVYESSVAIGPPGPQPPYGSLLSTFNGTGVRGTWKLWVYDDHPSVDGGILQGAQLLISTEVPLTAEETTIATPATASVSTQPFVRVEGRARLKRGGTAVTWRVTNGGAFYDAGAFTVKPAAVGALADFVGTIPLKEGANVISWFVTTTGRTVVPAPVTVNVDELTYSFAEGATGSFFDLDVTLGNPSGVEAPVRVDFLPEVGGTVTHNETVSANAPLPLNVDTIVPDAAVSTVVHSTNAIPLAVERTMIWDGTGYGGHGGTAVAPHTRWLFAEGAQGYFDTFVLLANDNSEPTDVVVKFLLEGAGVVTVPVTVGARQRHTLFAGAVPALVNQSFGIDVSATRPIIAERAMYLAGARLFEGGHESAGVNEPSMQWFLAEGATGAFFESYVLLSNPSASDAHVTLTYLLPTGATLVRAVTVPASGRHTINIEAVDPQLANADVSTTIVSDVGIVAERAMYWPDVSAGWREAHNSFGVIASALRWGLADGRIGGARAFQTYLLLANPNPYPAEVEVRYLKPGFTVTRAYTLPASSRRSVWINSEVAELGDGTFSADVRVLNHQPIAVEKAMYWNAGGEVFAGGTNVTATRLPPP